jgi:hypothetical protein
VREQDKGVGGVEADSNHIEFSHKLIAYWERRGKFTGSLTVAVRSGLRAAGTAHLLSYQYLFLRVLSPFPAGAKRLPPLRFK